MLSELRTTNPKGKPGRDPRLLINIFGATKLRKRRAFKEKQNWILARLKAEWEREKRISSHPYPASISSSDEDDEAAWHEEFGGQRIYYTMGNHVSPDFARTLRAMWNNGILYRSTAGNQGAREGGYAMKTYYVSYRCKHQTHEAKRIRIEADEKAGRKTLVESGMEARSAVEFVVGKQNLDTAIGELYESLRAA